MGRIEIKKTGITSLDVDALVNAANEGLWEGGGVCGIIFKAAGSQELQAACNAIGGCKTGSAVWTFCRISSKFFPRWCGFLPLREHKLNRCGVVFCRLFNKNSRCGVVFCRQGKSYAGERCGFLSLPPVPMSADSRYCTVNFLQYGQRLSAEVGCFV